MSIFSSFIFFNPIFVACATYYTFVLLCSLNGFFFALFCCLLFDHPQSSRFLSHFNALYIELSHFRRLSAALKSTAFIYYWHRQRIHSMENTNTQSERARGWMTMQATADWIESISKEQHTASHAKCSFICVHLRLIRCKSEDEWVCYLSSQCAAIFLVKYFPCFVRNFSFALHLLFIHDMRFTSRYFATLDSAWLGFNFPSPLHSINMDAFCMLCT